MKMHSTEHLEATVKSAVLLEALPCIQHFRDTIFAIKYGGAFMDDANPEMRTLVATDIAFLHTSGIKVVIIHGGGKAITRALEEIKVETRFEHGLRVTDEKTVKIVDHTLNQIVNPQICESLKASNMRPIGIPGNQIFVCKKKETVAENGTRIDLGFVGEIETVKAEPVKKALKDGYIPVISPVACDEQGQIYNTNADAAASHIAIALQARRLIYLCDVPGLVKNSHQRRSIISSLKAKEVADLLADGTIGQGMIPKTNSAVTALKNGVHRIHFIAGSQPHSLLEIFTDKGIGTEIIND